MELFPIIGMTGSRIACVVLLVGFAVWGIYVYHVDRRKKSEAGGEELPRN